jgi:hypothetical protein
MERQTMDHAFAVKFEACEKYILGELSPELRDAFEEHYFSCAECAAQVMAATQLAGASREILAGESRTPERAEAGPSGVGWWGWFRPAIAVPAFVVLLLFAGYQNFVTIPALKNSGEAKILPMYSLVSSNTRGEEGTVFHAGQGESFGVYVDIPYQDGYGTYSMQLIEPEGRQVPLRSVSGEEAKKTQVVILGAGQKPGKYVIVISGRTNAGTAPAAEKELARIQFAVERQN